MSSLHSKPAGNLSAEASAGNAQPAKVSFAEFQAHGIHFSPEEQAVQQIAFSTLIEKANPGNMDRILALSQKYLAGTRVLLAGATEIDESEGMRLIENEAVAAEMLRLIGDEEALTMAETIDRQIVEAREKFKRMIEAKRGISHLLDDATDSTESAMRFHTDYGQINAAIKKSLPERSRQNPVILNTENMWHLWAISFCDINIIRKTNNLQNTTKGGLIVSQTMFEGSVTAKFQGFIANAARTHYTTADGANLIIQMRSGLNEIAAEAKSVTEGHPVQTVQDFQRMVDRFEKNLAVAFSGKPFITWHDFHEIIVRLCDQRMFAIDQVFNNVLVTEQSKVRIQQAFDRIADKAVKNEIGLNSIIDAEQLEKYFTRDREIFQKTFDKCASKVPESARKALLDLIEIFRVSMHDEARDKMIKPQGTMISSQPIRILSAGNVTDSSKDGSEPERLVALNSNVDAVPEDIAAVKQFHSPKPIDANYFLFLVHGKEIDEYTNLFDEEQVRLKRNFVEKYGSVVDSIIDVFEKESLLIFERQGGDMTEQSHEKMCDDLEAAWRRVKKNLEPYMNDEWVSQHVAQSEKVLSERRTYGLQLLQLPPTRGGKTVNSTEVRSTLVNGIRALSTQINGDLAGTLIHNRFVVAMNEMFANYIPTELACQAEIDAASHLLEFQIRNECYNVKCLANNGVVAEAEGLDLSRIEDFETSIRLLIKWAINKATASLRLLQQETDILKDGSATETLEKSDLSAGLPRSLFTQIILEANVASDKELSMDPNAVSKKVLCAIIEKNCSDPIRNPNEVISFFSWYYGWCSGITSTAYTDYAQTEHVRDTKILHANEALRVVMNRMWPDIYDMDFTLADLPKGKHSFFNVERAKWSNVNCPREDIVADLEKTLHNTSIRIMKRRKGRRQMSTEEQETFETNKKVTIQALRSFASLRLPENFWSELSFNTLYGFLIESTFAWVEAFILAHSSNETITYARQSLGNAYQGVIQNWRNEMLRQRAKSRKPKYDSIIALPDPALKPVEKTVVQDHEFVAKLWKGKFSGLLAEQSTSLAEGCLKEGAYFASRSQQTQTQSKLREYFGTLETAFHTAIDMACVESTGQLSGVPSTASLSRHLRQAIMSVMVPEGLATLFTDQLELLQVELEDFVVREFSDATSFSHILRIEGKTSGAWDEGLGSLFDKESSSGSEISLEKILPETASIKNRCTAAFVRTVLFESLQGRGSADAIPESAFSLTWIDKIHGVISKSIDEYVAKEPRRGQFVEDVITTMFRGTRQMALMARLGASVSQEFGTGGAALLQESVILKMRGITGVDMLSGQTPDCAGLRAEVLQITGRLEELAILKAEDMALDQFLRQKLQSDEGTAADQLITLIPDIESLVLEINRGCHMGHELRTTDWAYVLLSERADSILEEVIVLSSTHEIDVKQSPDAARLVALQTENDAWISSWPDAPKSSEAHAGFLQVVTNWNGTAKAVSDGCRQGVVFDARTIATAILDAECVRDAREKNIVVVRENGGVRKPGMMVHHHKIRALLDLRAAKEIGLRALGSAGIDPRAASIVVDVHALTLELAALERTLGSTDEDAGDRDAASKILEQKRTELGEAEKLATELESMLQETAEEMEAAMRELPHVLIALNAVITSETERGAELRAGVRKAEQETDRASERLMQYTSTGGRDVEMLSEMSAAQSDAQSHESSIRAELEIFEFSDSVAMLSVERDALIGIGQEWEPADTAPAYSTDPKELAKSARRVRVTVEDRKSIQEARENARQVADVAKRNVEHLSALASDSSIVAGSRNSLQIRRRDIVGTLQHVRELLSALTQGK